MPKGSIKILISSRNQQSLHLPASPTPSIFSNALSLMLGASKCNVQMLKDMEVTPKMYCAPPTGNLQVQEDKGKFIH